MESNYLNFMKFFSYAKNDPQKEKIDKIIANSYEDALEYFAERKHMSKFDFLKIYAIGSE